MVEKGNDKDFQTMKEVWRAIQAARQELTKAQERADALAGNVVNLPELPVSSCKYRLLLHESYYNRLQIIDQKKLIKLLQ